MSRREGARATCAAALGVLMVAALSAEVQAQGLKLTGYGDMEWSLVETGDPDNKYNNFFDNHHFNLIALAWIIPGNVVAAGEVEYEHAGEEIILEYAYLAFTGFRGIRLVGGKFILPFNRWNKDLHPTFISKVPGRPLPNAEVFPSTYADVGLWATGGIGLGRSGSRVTYDAYAVNGLKGDQDESSWRSLRDNDREKPDGNDNKAVGGRVGLELPMGLDFGVSGYTGEYATDTLTSSGLDISFLGADFNFHWQELEFRGEYVYGSQDLSTGDNDKRNGLYLQLAYLLARTQNVLVNFEPVVRYSLVNFDGGDEDDAQQVGLGLNYYLSASTALRAVYYINIEKDAFKRDNNAIITQFSILF